MTSPDEDPWTRLVLDGELVKAARHREGAAWERRISVTPSVRRHPRSSRARGNRGRRRGRMLGGKTLIVTVMAVASVIGVKLLQEPELGTTPIGGEPDRYGDRWAPILIAWSDEAETPDLTGDVAGIGGSVSASRAQWHPRVYVTGIVTLDGPQLERLLSAPDGPRIARGIIVHEPGHLVGLAHVEDPNQLLHAGGPAPEPGTGDLTGLARLGAGPCMSTS